MKATEGGFFHSPQALLAGAPRGEAVFAALVAGRATLAVAVGVKTGCRLSRRFRHLYLPSAPAVVPRASSENATDSLLAEFSRDGIYEVVIDSFDASWSPSVNSASRPLARRAEYVVALPADADDLDRQFVRGHRRHIARGQRDGWRMETLVSRWATVALEEVQRSASHRAEWLGRQFAPARFQFGDQLSTNVSSPFGTAVFAAFEGEVLLSAALVGWMNGRAFYVLGGSTPHGYRQSSATWLHWRVMTELVRNGFHRYNLGGTAATATEVGDPEHGLYRFKTGFGAQVVDCRGWRGVLSPTHARMHDLLQRLSRS